MDRDSEKAPIDLLNSSKKKFTLGQARLRRGQIELMLLSLYGSLEDGLRAYALLHGYASARSDWSTLLLSLAEDTNSPLSQGEYERLQHIAHLRNQIVQGDTVTVTEESAISGQQFACTLLRRYGVLVVATELTTLPSSAREAASQSGKRPVQPWERPPAKAPVALLTILLVGLVAAAFFWLAGVRYVPDLSGAARQTSGPMPTQVATPPPTPADPLLNQRTAFVRATLDEDLALRAQPGDAPDNTVQMYIAPDTAVQIISGPVHLNGVDWWQVSAANQSGWCPGEFLEVR